MTGAARGIGRGIAESLAEQALAAEVYEEGIRVHLVMPGGIATDMVRNVRPDIDDSDPVPAGTS